MTANLKVRSRMPVLVAGLFLLAAVAFYCLPAKGQGTVEDSVPATKKVNPAAPGIPQLTDAPLLPVVEKQALRYRTAEVTVDPRKHCLFIGQPPASGQGVLRADLERGVTYTVTAAGEAFMSNQKGVDADPFPGVVFYYSTDEEDGYAVRYVVLKPGDSVTFRTPWLIAPADEVFAAAFFLDAWPSSENHGDYTLTFRRGDG